MGIGTAAAIALGAGGLAGAVGGAIPRETTSTSKSTVNLGEMSELDKLLSGAGANSVQGQYGQLTNLISSGPDQADVSNSLNASRSLASLLEQYAQGGFLPSASDISTAGTQAANLFQGQRTALAQSFQDQEIEANRRAALQGRSLSDPILAAKLGVEQTRQSSQLSANQGSLAQQLAMAMPGQRLGFASDRANLLGGLASQAMANRQALLSLGSQLQGSERNWRFNVADKTNASNQTTGGGFGGALSGLFGGAGAGLSLASTIESLPSFSTKDSTVKLPSTLEPRPHISLGNFTFNQPGFGSFGQ